MIRITNGKQFAVDLEAFAKAVGVTRQTVYRRATVDIWNKIVDRTPVDTGRAHASWNIAEGAPDTRVPPKVGKGQKLARPTLPAVAGTLNATQTIYITSNLDYINPLEKGHSKQAPTGMVMVAAAEFAATAQLTIEAMSNE